jgi:hypothetical protein
MSLNISYYTGQEDWEMPSQGRVTDRTVEAHSDRFDGNCRCPVCKARRERRVVRGPPAVESFEVVPLEDGDLSMDFPLEKEEVSDGTGE